MNTASTILAPPTEPADAEPTPPAIDWATVELPEAWADHLRFSRLGDLRRLWRSLSGRERQPVALPAGMPGAERIPAYVLQEFHNLPNGNYSRRFSRGYAKGFDRSMLGTLRQGRPRIARALAGAQRALDLGSGAGHLAVALHAAGIDEVWGLEPSPYLLQQAAQAAPQVRWEQGTGEDSGLPSDYFDAVGVCFVFHEVPPRYLRRILAELARITRPGARLAVLEPSPEQWTQGFATLVRRYGWRGAYFRALAHHVHEPFLDAWHKQDFGALLAEHGFRLVEDDIGCPFRFFLAERIAGA